MDGFIEALPGIIWLIIIVIGVANANKNKAKAREKKLEASLNKPASATTRSVPVRNEAPVITEGRRMLTPSQSSTIQSSSVSSGKNTVTIPASVVSPKNGKTSKENKSAKVASASNLTAKPQSKNVILERAKDNNLEENLEHHHIHDEEGHNEVTHSAELKNVAGIDDFDTYHLMDEVYDLIVKGYDGGLCFKRDFISEGTDMLNRLYDTHIEISEE